MYPGGKSPCECFQAEKVVGGGEPGGIRHVYLACALLLCSDFPIFSSGLYMWRSINENAHMNYAFKASRRHEISSKLESTNSPEGRGG